MSFANILQTSPEERIKEKLLAQWATIKDIIWALSVTINHFYKALADIDKSLYEQFNPDPKNRLAWPNESLFRFHSKKAVNIFIKRIKLHKSSKDLSRVKAKTQSQTNSVLSEELIWREEFRAKLEREWLPIGDVHTIWNYILDNNPKWFERSKIWYQPRFKLKKEFLGNALSIYREEIKKIKPKTSKAPRRIIDIKKYENLFGH